MQQNNATEQCPHATEQCPTPAQPPRGHLHCHHSEPRSDHHTGRRQATEGAAHQRRHGRRQLRQAVQDEQAPRPGALTRTRPERRPRRAREEPRRGHDSPSREQAGFLRSLRPRRPPRSPCGLSAARRACPATHSATDQPVCDSLRSQLVSSLLTTLNNSHAPT